MNILVWFRKIGFWLFLGLAPLAANAETLNPAGGNTWDLYVYGNGQAIASILTAIKLTIAPDSGGQSFTYLLLFLATLGFLLMAVKAGFDPAKNLLKMFVFIFVVYGVNYATVHARTNIHVYDRFGQPGANDFYVTGVPALVGLPAALVSQAGEFLTRQIEQNFSLPHNADASAMNLSSVGQYDLFAKLMSDASKYTITDPDLRRTLTAYISDCGVTAIALGKMSVSDLMNNPNMMDVLSKAQNNAIMTRYYPSSQTQSNCALIPSGPTTGEGVLGTCAAVYSCLATDLPAHAKALLDATQGQWQSSGVVAPLETAMSSALAMAGANGGAGSFAGYSSPQGYILQNAMLSVSSGAFRDAAARTGNNEIMMATSIAQAEQSQKSSWFTASELFKNMMGYVFTVLQAFIFAMVPVIVICLMIPGMGGKIFTNYAQILVWLTLWAPMLAIVNFLVEVFGSAQMAGTLGAAGLTMQNQSIVTDQANNLVIVAQFMGTLVPIMTWGLVKGALGFTELISHGIGTSFATQAGAQAATGNVSMGNLSMDNVGMNKYSTAMTSNVGVQSVKADYGAGSATGSHDFGGNTAKANDGSTNVSTTTTRQYSFQDSTRHSTTLSETDAKTFMSQNSHMANEASSFNTNFSDALQRAEDWSKSHDMSDSTNREIAAKLGKQVSDTSTAGVALTGAVNAGLKWDVGPNLPKGSIGASFDAKRNYANQQLVALNHALDEAESRGHKTGSSTSHGDKDSHSAGYSESGGLKRDISQAHAVSESLSEASQRADQLSHDSGFTVTSSTTQSVSHVTAADGTNGGLQAVTSQSGSGLDSMFNGAEKSGPSRTEVMAGGASTRGAIDQIGSQVQGDNAHLGSTTTSAGADAAQLHGAPALTSMDGQQLSKDILADQARSDRHTHAATGAAVSRFGEGGRQNKAFSVINPLGENAAADVVNNIK